MLVLENICNKFYFPLDFPPQVSYNTHILKGTKMKLTRRTSISLIILAVIFFYIYYTTPMASYDGKPDAPRIKIVKFFDALLTNKLDQLDVNNITIFPREIK